MTIGAHDCNSLSSPAAFAQTCARVGGPLPIFFYDGLTCLIQILLLPNDGQCNSALVADTEDSRELKIVDLAASSGGRIAEADPQPAFSMSKLACSV